ncbi:MAG: ferritin-like domain-containing protein [candidate division KSB1 bacterium]|nr:ferritin-like domain-containing protein [candidate division KSB1 bacterium]MDQ7065136.1 ferritin-like domain-containing protein [candidate division KSB1 bacterium]
MNLLEKLEQGWQKLASNLDSKQQAERKLLEALQRDYAEEIGLAEALKKQSENVPYDHLRQKLLNIAEAEQRHAEMLREKIRELGGEVKARRLTGDSLSTLDLLKILEEEKEEYTEYLNARALAQEAEREDIRELLERIREEEVLHRKQLMDVLSRLNPLPIER